MLTGQHSLLRSADGGRRAPDEEGRAVDALARAARRGGDSACSPSAATATRPSRRSPRRRASAAARSSGTSGPRKGCCGRSPSGRSRAGRPRCWCREVGDAGGIEAMRRALDAHRRFLTDDDRGPAAVLRADVRGAGPRPELAGRLRAAAPPPEELGASWISEWLERAEDCAPTSMPRGGGRLDHRARSAASPTSTCSTPTAWTSIASTPQLERVAGARAARRAPR